MAAFACYFFRSQSRKAAKKNAACAKHPAGPSSHLEHDFKRLNDGQDAIPSCKSFKSLKSCSDKERGIFLARKAAKPQRKTLLFTRGETPSAYLFLRRTLRGLRRRSHPGASKRNKLAAKGRSHPPTATIGRS